jgi:carbon storage regulator
MLVLSRKINETIYIGDDVRVTLLGIDGDKIKLGIEAPKAMKIYREELLEATKNINRQAIQAAFPDFSLAKLAKKPPAAEKTSE